MLNSGENNKRIAKNTLFLYVRMLLIMLVSLYTVRVILNTLGVVDYGIFNVVGGIVVMFSFLSATLGSALQRFFAFELGKNNNAELNRIFSLSLIIFAFLALIIILFAETIGIWFLNTQMIIPLERMEAANWIFQFSILSFVVTLIVIPYNSMLIAHENMKIYAYLSVLEALLKLLIVYLLVLFSFDKLKFYSVLIFCTTATVSLIYSTVCKRKYSECHFSFYWDKESFKTLISYSSWNMVGAVANILKTYGTNILLNIFFGPIVNAARSIAFQVNAALNGFVTNFYMAVRPQITKAFAAGEFDFMMHLVFRSTKISYYLLLILSMPLLIETEFILNIWLKNVPEGTVFFVQLLIINVLIEVINNQLVAALQAAGNIKKYQAVISTMLMLILPISYLFFYFGASPEYTFYISIGIALLCFIPQLLIVKKVIGLSIRKYWKEVIRIIIIVTILSYLTPLIISHNMQFGSLRFFIVSSVGFISCLITIYYTGLSKDERNYVVLFIKDKFLKKSITQN